MKKTLKTVLALSLALVMVLGMAACGSSSTTTAPAANTAPASNDAPATNEAPAASNVDDLAPVNFIIASSAASANATYQTQVEDAAATTEATGGKLTFQLSWDGTLGNDAELIEACFAGDVPIVSVASSPLLSYIPEIGVFDCPVVYSDGETAFAGIGQFEETFDPIFENVGLKILGMGFTQFRGLSTNTLLEKPEDFKGMKIRTMENQYHMAFWNNMGAAPTPLAFSELYTALQQGLVDAQDNPLGALVATKFNEVQKYWMSIPAFPFVSFLIMNLDTFNSLDPYYQEALENFAHTWLHNCYTVQIEDDVKTVNYLNEEGKVTILEMTDDIYAAMVEAAKPVWNQIATDIGADVVDAYLATGGQTRG